MEAFVLSYSVALKYEEGKIVKSVEPICERGKPRTEEVKRWAKVKRWTRRPLNGFSQLQTEQERTKTSRKERKEQLQGTNRNLRNK